jgi:2-hydroxychromene-2-carboxylate isomerase
MDTARRTLFCVAAEMTGQAAVYCRSMFKAVYVDQKAIDDDDGRASKHRETTITRALKLGAFGVPTFAWNGELYFGNDRIVLLRRALIAVG